MLCPFCHNETPEHSPFCSHCQRQIPRCPTCGKALDKPVRFCKADGTRIPDEVLALFPGEEQPKPEAVPVAPASEEKKFGKQFSLPQVMLFLVIAVCAVALILLLANNEDAETPQAAAPQVTAPTVTLPTFVVPTDTITEATEQTTEATTEAPTTVPETTEETEPPTTERSFHYESRYEIISSNGSWLEAKAACEAKGGHLATITSWQEFDEIAKLANRTGLVYLWVGAYLPNDYTSWQEAGWITGESWTFENWYPGEPSGWDQDGTRERYLCIWTVNRGSWTFNDQRNDIVARLPSISGLVGYVCEYEIVVYD